MSELLIKPFCKHQSVGCFSELTHSDSNLKLFGVEQFYNSNTPFISCIPEGDYALKEFDSERHGRTFAFCNPVLDVFSHFDHTENDKQRFACVIHVANRFDQLQGCYAPGLSLGFIPLRKKPPIWGVRSSGKAVRLLRPILFDGMKVKIISV